MIVRDKEKDLIGYKLFVTLSSKNVAMPIRGNTYLDIAHARHSGVPGQRVVLEIGAAGRSARRQ
jgi:hypothetical protein